MVRPCLASIAFLPFGYSIVSLRFRVRHLRECSGKFTATASRGPRHQDLLREKGGHLFRDRRANELIDRYSFFLGDFTESAVQGFRQTETQRTHVLHLILSS